MHQLPRRPSSSLNGANGAVGLSRSSSSSSSSSSRGRRISGMSPRVGVIPHFLLFLLFVSSSSCGATSDQRRPAAAEMTPVAGLAVESLVLNETRRRLGSFQICAVCTCCGGDRGLCLPSPCCYAINCNIPNRPFGFCSFTPKSCNCFGCYL